MPRFEVDPDIARARTLDKTFYTSPTHYESAKDKLFGPSWQFVGHAGLVEAPESAVPVNMLPGFLDEPLMLVKDSAGIIRCLSNVCTHRGNLLVTAPCHVDKLRCNYHGRQFHLDGRFAFMPEFKEVKDFPSAADDLRNMPLHTWGKLLFASLGPAPDAAVFFGEMQARLGWLPMDQLAFRPDLSREYEAKAHWALYTENFLEGFHIPFVHPTLNKVLDFGDYTTELFPRSVLQVGVGRKGDVCFDIPDGSPDHGRSIAAYYWWVFPNLMFNFYPWGLSLNVVQPLAIDRSRISFLSYVYAAGKLGTGAGAQLDEVEHEDEEVVQQVQQGIRSRNYAHGRYSVTREQGTHHFHRLIAGLMG